MIYILLIHWVTFLYKHTKNFALYHIGFGSFYTISVLDVVQVVGVEIVHGTKGGDSGAAAGSLGQELLV